MKIANHNKCSDRSSQEDKKVVSISFIKNLVNGMVFTFKLIILNWLIHMMHNKNLKRLNKIVLNLNENEHERFREIFPKKDLLIGSKGSDVHEVFFHFSLKNEFINTNCQHVLDT